jgi:hypothetical protein
VPGAGNGALVRPWKKTPGHGQEILRLAQARGIGKRQRGSIAYLTIDVKKIQLHYEQGK